MAYLLVENRTTVLLGPMGSWKPRFIQAELDELEIDYKVSPAEPENGYLKIPDTNLEIMTLISLDYPPCDSIYQYYAGPFYTYNNDNTVSGTHEVFDVTNLDLIRPSLKNIVANNRYTVEIAGTKATVQDTVVTLDTSRDGRNVFIQKFLLMKPGETVEWKFPECWLTLTYEDLGLIVQTGANHIQSQFVWEAATVAQIDAASTVEELKAIVLTPVAGE
jgi:hypothetical protein